MNLPKELLESFEEEDRLETSIIPFHDEIIGIKKGNVYIKNIDAVIVTSKEEYLRLCSLWLDRKEGICNSYKHFCGIFGNFSAIDSKEIGTIELNDQYDEETDTMNSTKYTIIAVEKFDDLCDMEHG
jgi:hypothetical protein